MFTKLVRGSVVRLDVVLTDISGAFVDPGALALKLRDPAGSIATISPVKDSTGHYHVDVALPTAGTWQWRWEATAPNAGASEGQMVVADSLF